MLLLGLQSSTSAGLTDTEKVPKKLYGHIDTLQSSCQSSGIIFAGEKFPATIKAIVPGSLAESANLAPNDQVIEAKISDNKLLLEVVREGQQYQAAIDLSTDGLVKESPLSAGHARSRHTASVQSTGKISASKKKLAAMLGVYNYDAAMEMMRHPDCGWTQQSVVEQRIWTSEARGANRVLEEQWWQKFRDADDYLNQHYMDKQWPLDLLGKRVYHVVFDRTGKVLNYYRNFEPEITWWGDFGDPAKFDQHAAAAIEILSKSRIWAAPTGSHVTRFNCQIEFQNVNLIINEHGLPQPEYRGPIKMPKPVSLSMLRYLTPELNYSKQLVRD